MPKRAAPPPPGVRENLLGAALDLFTQKGYAATTVREIVEAAHVTKPALYYYFHSKEGVYLEILGESLEGFRKVLAGLPGDSLRADAALRNLCDTIFVQFQDNIKVVRLVYAAFYGPPQCAPPFDFEAFHTLLSGAISRWIDVGIRRGQFRRGDRQAMTLAVLGAFDVATEIELIHGRDAVGRKGLSGILDIVLNGMRAGGPAKEATHGKH